MAVVLVRPGEQIPHVVATALMTRQDATYPPPARMNPSSFLSRGNEPALVESNAAITESPAERHRRAT